MPGIEAIGVIVGEAGIGPAPIGAGPPIPAYDAGLNAGAAYGPCGPIMPPPIPASGIYVGAITLGYGPAAPGIGPYCPLAAALSRATAAAASNRQAKTGIPDAGRERTSHHGHEGPKAVLQGAVSFTSLA